MAQARWRSVMVDLLGDASDEVNYLYKDGVRKVGVHNRFNKNIANGILDNITSIEYRHSSNRDALYQTTPHSQYIARPHCSQNQTPR
jgi:hypothetical protein